MSTLQRLRQMTFEECAWRARASARTTTDRVRARVRTPRWNRRDLAQALSPARVDSDTRTALAREDWSRVHATLVRRLTERPSRFVVDPTAADRVRDEILSRWPSAAEDAAARADRILDGQYDILGYRSLRFSPPSSSTDPTGASTIDWHRDPVHRRRAPMTCWAEVPYLDPAIGDHKIIWELNRHQHWLQLGRAAWLTRQRRYAAAIVEELESWLAANPPLTGVNWASMLEIGLRTISWTGALHLLLADLGRGPEESARPEKEQPWLVDMLVAIDRQLAHVERHLSYYFSPNTHLTGEALSLYVVGHALPELAASDRWQATGRGILLREIDRQILADGGHAERSTHYQRYTLDFYLLALLTAERNGDAEAAARFSDVVTRLAGFTHTMADDRGRLPLIGDDDGGMLWPLMGRECNDVRDSLAMAGLALRRPDVTPWGLPEEGFWIAPRVAIERAALLEHPRDRPSPSVSCTFAGTGYVVARDEAGGHAVFDVGAHGYMNGGHAHADALSVTLSLASRPLLIDPGTSTYTMDPALRDRMRRTSNHNTVTVDGRAQSDPAGPFHWRRGVNAQLHASRHGRGFDWAEASHAGYAPITHRRSLIRADAAGWLIVDELVGDSSGRSDDCHSMDIYWHFDPGWMLRTGVPGRLRATHFEGADAWLLHDTGELSAVHGDVESGLGWYAPVYGTLIPTWTACVTRREVVPFFVITWIGPAAETAGALPALDRIAVTSDPDGAAIAARVVTGGETSVFLLHPGGPAARDSRACSALDYETNARVLHFRSRGERLVTLDLVDGSHALALRDGWVGVEASEPIADLHAIVSGGVLDLSTSEPPRQLQVQGHEIARLQSIFLNGRPYRPTAADTGDSLRIPGGEWGAPLPLVHSGASFALDVARLAGCEEFLPSRESSW